MRYSKTERMVLLLSCIFAALFIRGSQAKSQNAGQRDRTAYREAQYDILAAAVREHLDMTFIYDVLEDICCKGRMSNPSKYSKGGRLIRSSLRRRSRRGRCLIQPGGGGSMPFPLGLRSRYFYSK